MKTKNVIGIDVSKDKLSLFNDYDDSFEEISNSNESLLDYITKHNLEKENFKIGLESTGDHSYLPMKFFVDKDFETIVINPIITKKYIKSSVRGKKTDENDAKIVVRMINDNEGLPVDKNGLNTSKKTLLRTENKLTMICSDLKRIKKSLELKQKNEVDTSVALNEIDRLIEEVSISAKKIFNEVSGEGQTRQEEIIDSLPGCALKLSCIISQESGDITRFEKPEQFVAYAGLDPKVTQSGRKMHLGKITKRGNPFLRKSLFLAANVARMHDPELKEFYEKKKSEGKHHKAVVCAVARKLCLRIHASVRENRLYQKVRLSEVKS